MTKRLAILVPAVLAAGALLLTACGDKDADATGSAPTGKTASSSSQKNSAIAQAAREFSLGVGGSVSGSDDQVDPVNCGEVDLGKGEHHELIADVVSGARVGCTEAFNVIDEFLNLPDDALADAGRGYVEVSGGWFCTSIADDIADVSCGKDETPDGEYGFTLHTEPQAG